MKKFFIFFFLCSLTLYAQDDVMPLRIVTYNIQHGAGMDDVIDLDRQAKVIGDVLPDVVGLQEVDSCVKRSNRIHQAAVLAKSLGMYSTFGPAIPLTGGKYGVAILSREEPLSHYNIPLPGNEKRTLLVCEFQEYVFACTHLALEEENRLTSLDIILEEAARWDKPFIICGDWNDQPSSTLISKMKKSFVFLSNITNNSTNYTFPARTPNRIIDYVASYGRVIKSIRKRQVLNEPEASDHRPVLVEITLPRYTTAIAEIQGSEAASSKIQDSGFKIQGSEAAGSKIQDSGFKIQGSEAAGSKIQDSGFKFQDSGDNFQFSTFNSQFVYDLSGRKLNGKHSTVNSIYILNNKKYAKH